MFFYMVYKSGQIFLSFCHNPRVWQTDRQRDRQTDGRTDRILLAIPRLHYMQRGKKKSSTPGSRYPYNIIYVDSKQKWTKYRSLYNTKDHLA